MPSQDAAPTSATEAPNTDITDMSFESAMRELENIVQKLESGAIDLEASIEIYSRGTQLKAHCETKLKSAQSKVEQIVSSTPGQASGIGPFDVN